mmetsp:Transcript_73656/g.146001  ORF Transcript_73656/g.146001 Transcript_73656/m.146001 type:complete len:110 (-) Transcript_73656:477-806(-)
MLAAAATLKCPHNSLKVNSRGSSSSNAKRPHSSPTLGMVVGNSMLRGQHELWLPPQTVFPTHRAQGWRVDQAEGSLQTILQIGPGPVRSPVLSASVSGQQNFLHRLRRC